MSNSGGLDGVTKYYHNRNQIIEMRDGSGTLETQAYHKMQKSGDCFIPRLPPDGLAMGYRKEPEWVMPILMMVWAVFAAAQCGAIGWWILAIVVVGSVLYEKFRFRRLRREPCDHGTVGAKRNRELCERCKAADAQAREAAEKIRKCKEEKFRLERERAHNQFLKQIRLPSFLRDMDPFAFEALACDLHEKMGYEVETTRQAGDGGVDGLFRKDGELTILQAKRVKGSVGEPILRDLFGTMHALDAQHGVVVTTGKVSKQARQWASGKPIRIIELDELVSLIRQLFPEDEVVPVDFKPLRAQADICPKCRRPLMKRSGRHGAFMGCSGYPSCKYTRNQ